MAMDTPEDSDCEDESCEYSREELLSSNPFTLKNFSKRKTRYMALFDVDRWVAELQDTTFATEVEQLEWDEAEAVKHFYQEGVCGHCNKVTPADEKALGKLRTKLESMISKLRTRSHCEGAFVRLGPRSPKDAPMMVAQPRQETLQSLGCTVGFTEDEIRTALEEAMQTCAPRKNCELCDQHDLLRYFQDVCNGLLRVTAANDALKLLVSSARVMQDICHTMDTGRDGWNVGIVARAWDEEVKLEREFRCFVVDGELTAISQYDDQLMYDFVVDSAAHAPEKITIAICDCLASVKTKIKALSGNRAIVVDFLIIPSMDASTSTWQARIIEVNPFGPMTGAALFSWTSDRRILQGGSDLYGDLDACELQTPAGSVPLPEHVEEVKVLSLPFRYLKKNPATFGWPHLRAFWHDYVRLAPAGLVPPA
jgi:hypothetical protein